MPKPTGPGAELQDAVSGAVSAFMKAANHALASVEEANKEEVKRVMQDVREAQRERDELRRERDALLQEKVATAVELEAAKGESERWRASAEKAEWMINHQGETINQLRLEAQQWKDQFMRSDDERLRLSTRNDELVSQQLYANRREAYYQEPLTPRSQGPQAQGSSSTRAVSNTQFASSSVPASGYVTDGDILNHRAHRDEVYSHLTRSKGTRNATTARSAKAQPVASSSRHVAQPQAVQSISAQHQLQQQQLHGKVLRTVHVVMQGDPVKEESLDSVSLNDTHSGSESLSGADEEGAQVGDEEEEADHRTPHARMPLQPVQTQTQTQQKRRVAAGKQRADASQSRGRGRGRGRGTATRRRWSEGRQVLDEDEDEEESESASGSEDEADEYVPSSHPPVRRPRAARPDEVDEEEEDELMLGGEADRHETHTPQKQKPRPTGAHTPIRRAHTQPARQANGSTSSRKRNSPYPTVATKKARNR